MQAAGCVGSASALRAPAALPLARGRAAAAPAARAPLTVEAAHKKGAGSTKNGRDSNAKRLGVKVYGDQPCNAGSIIIRQRGSKVIAGKNVGTGNDYTLFSKIEGTVKFETKKGRSVVSVYPTVEKVINPDSRRAKKYASYTPRAELRAAIEAANAAA